MLVAAESVETQLIDTERELLDLEIAVQRVRLKRLEPSSVPAPAAELAERAHKLFEETVYAGLRQRPDLVLSFVEEVGPQYPAVVARVLSLMREATPPDAAAQQALSYALAGWDAKLAGAAPGEPGSLARAAGLPPDDDAYASWLAYVNSVDVSTLLAILEKLTREYAPTAEVVRAIVQVLRGRPDAPGGGDHLSDESFQQMRMALFSAYLNRSELAAAVQDALGEDLERIAGAEIYDDVLFNLIRWAEQNRRTADLTALASGASSAPPRAKGTRGSGAVIVERPSSQQQPKQRHGRARCRRAAAGAAAGDRSR